MTIANSENITNNNFCVGKAGVQQMCLLNGVMILVLAPGIGCEDHVDFIKDSVRRCGHLARWRICSWHESRSSLQAEYKDSNVEIEVYEACRKIGALITTAHAHVYCRTHPIQHFDDDYKKIVFGLEVRDDDRLASGLTSILQDEREERRGTAVVTVIGMGGRNHRSMNSRVESQHYWAKVYTKTQQAEFGALFCDFYCESRLDRACCYFLNTKGVRVDQFTLIVDAS